MIDDCDGDCFIGKYAVHLTGSGALWVICSGLWLAAKCQVIRFLFFFLPFPLGEKITWEGANFLTVPKEALLFCGSHQVWNPFKSADFLFLFYHMFLVAWGVKYQFNLGRNIQGKLTMICCVSKAEVKDKLLFNSVLPDSH